MNWLTFVANGVALGLAPILVGLIIGWFYWIWDGYFHLPKRASDALAGVTPPALIVGAALVLTGMIGLLVTGAP